jgi:Ca2+-transporting ATPase
LLVAVLLSLGTHVLVIYVPFLQVAFHTVALTLTDWVVTTLVAAVLLVGMEIVKLSLRAKPHYARRIGRAAPAE